MEAEYAIKGNLRKSEGPMAFSEMKESIEIPVQDLRRGLRELITNGNVYVVGVEDREKIYGIK